MSDDLIREIDCPRCGGKMTVLDNLIEVGGTTKWTVDRVVCHNGCQGFPPGSVPNRED